MVFTEWFHLFLLGARSVKEITDELKIFKDCPCQLNVSNDFCWELIPKTFPVSLKFC
jgi:hypothetical protein